MAAIQGLRGTGEFAADYRPTHYRELYTFLEPNGDAPLQALLAMTASESVDDPKFNNFRDELPERRFAIDNVGGYNAAAGTLQLAAGSEVGYVTIGSVIINSRTGETMVATADGDTANDQVTVTRNLGSTSFTINDGDVLFVGGSAHKEGADVGTAVSFDPTVSYNYCQIFRQPVNLTNTQKETYLRTGDKEDEMITKALKLHMSDMERAFFFGRRHIINASTSQPTRFTGGLTTSISQVNDLSTASTPNVMTEDEFDDYLIKTVFAYGSKQKLAFGGAQVAANLQKIGKNRWQPTVISGGTYGVKFTNYETMAGSLMFHLHPQFRQIPELASALVIIDFPYLKHRYMQNRDTALLQNRQGNGVDAVIHEYLTECGLELLQDKVHTYIKNWDAIS